MELKIIDNFLPEREFQILVNAITGISPAIDFRVVSTVEDSASGSEDYWSWYMIHMIYSMDMPQSKIYSDICRMFVPKFYEVANFKTMSRIKINAYPYTNIVKEHKEHTDTNYSHTGAVFSINTCDGYTKIKGETKVQSIANRIVFFDASEPHQSTTTSNAKLRYNINFNFL